MCKLGGGGNAQYHELIALEYSPMIVFLSRMDIGNLLQESVHEAFVRYTMNPFTKVRSKIERPCSKFEADVRESIEVYSKSLLMATNS